MDDKKYQIFVSSTYKDLIEAREAIVKTILSLYQIPIGMEMFSADDADQWEIISETISVSDYYIVIIGHRYGSETSEGISFTEKEYDYARQQGIPVQAFIRRRDVATKPEERDDALDKVKKLNAFIVKATADKMCDYWESTEELAKKVAIALTKTFRRNPRVGWVRADKAASPAITEELARLSKENRDLREEYDVLKAKLSGGRPLIDVLLNGSKEMSLSYKALDYRKRQQAYPQKIEYSLIAEHLRPFISQGEVDKYNKSLPPNHIIDIYNDFVERYIRIKKTGQDLSVTIFNEGTSKANEIFIEIEIPQQLIVVESEDEFIRSFPDNPMPENPLDKAEEKYRKEQTINRAKNAFELLSTFNDDINRTVARVPNIHSLFNRAALPADYSLWIKKNTIHIKLNGLLHTRRRQFDNIIIAAKEHGEFVAKGAIICAEFKEKQQFNIPIKVTD